MTTNLEERARELLRELGLMTDDGTPFYQEDLQACITFATSVQAEARERLAAWMIEHSFSTGHGDTFEDLLKELSWQVKELRQTVRLAALEEAADVGSAAAQAFIDDLDDKQILRAEDCAEKVATAIRALAQAAAPATKEE